jgi:ribosome hibernation promoting factor
MQVSITCRHGSIRQDQREYITRKSEKLVRFLEEVSEINVTLVFEGPRVTAEILVEIDGHHTIVAEVEGEDSIVSFDQVLTKMEHQVHRFKEKRRDHRRDKPMNEVAEMDTASEPESE